jgi:hypothetical protein
MWTSGHRPAAVPRSMCQGLEVDHAQEKQKDDDQAGHSEDPEKQWNHALPPFLRRSMEPPDSQTNAARGPGCEFRMPRAWRPRINRGAAASTECMGLDTTPILTI